MTEPFAKLTPTTPTPTNALFGFQVRMSENLAVTGAWGENFFKGAAYVFDTQTWSQLARLQPNDDIEGSGFGSSVDVHRDLVIV